MRDCIGVHFVTVYHFGKGMNKGEKLWQTSLPDRSHRVPKEHGALVGGARQSQLCRTLFA